MKHGKTKQKAGVEKNSVLGGVRWSIHCCQGSQLTLGLLGRHVDVLGSDIASVQDEEWWSRKKRGKEPGVLLPSWLLLIN